MYTVLQGEESQSAGGTGRAPLARAVGGRFAFAFSSSPAVSPTRRRKKKAGGGTDGGGTDGRGRDTVLGGVR